ncbi:MAG: nuclear transport factor 2 family protein [Steroidobacteraceae bacterium]
MSSRRSFIMKVGTGASAALAVTAGMASSPQPLQRPELAATLAEDERALRQLHRGFEQAMDKGLHAQVIGMFADDGRVLFNGGEFVGRDHGVSRLLLGQFEPGRSGTRMQPAPAFELPSDRQPDCVTVAIDRLSATATFPYSIQVGRPFDTETSLAAMARLHGGAVQTWWEGGLYHVDYRRAAAEHAWQISRLEYVTVSRADYRSGRSYARPIEARPFTTRFPADPQGPDGLV